MRRGIREEHDLIHRLDDLGFAVIRAPASGSRTKLDRPDIVAGKKDMHLAIEVKSTRKETIYIERECVLQLKRFSEKFGAKPILALKFKNRRLDWILIEPETLTPTGKGFKTHVKQAINKGKTLESLVSKSLADYLK